MLNRLSSLSWRTHVVDTGYRAACPVVGVNHDASSRWKLPRLDASTVEVRPGLLATAPPALDRFLAYRRALGDYRIPLSRKRMSRRTAGKSATRKLTHDPNGNSPSSSRGVLFQRPEGWGFDPGRSDAAPFVRWGMRAGTRLRFFSRSRRLRFTVVNRRSPRTRPGSTWALHWPSRKSSTSAQLGWSRIWGREAPVGSRPVSTSRKRGCTSDKHIQRWAWMSRVIAWV